MRISFTIKDKEVCCEVENVQGSKINYILKRNGKPIDETGFTAKNPYKWDVSETGFYETTIFVKKSGGMLQGQSETLQYFSEDDQGLYQDFLATDNEIRPKDLMFDRNHYPFHDFCILYMPPHSSALLNFCRQHKYYHTILFKTREKKCILVSSAPLKKIGNTQFLFSGLTRNKDKLIYGDNDLSNIDEIIDQIGNFQLVRAKKKSVDIRADYFGIGKMLYFSNEKVFALSNKYHFLLMVLQALSVKLSLQYDTVMANFCHVQNDFQQRAGRQMEIENIQLLPADSYIVIDHKGWRIDKTSLARDIAKWHLEEMLPSAYEPMLYKAKEEIVSNMRIALNHSDFQFVQLDLTGGMNTRLTYSAITNIPTKDRVKVHTGVYFPSAVRDYEIACMINNLYGYQYDDLPEVDRLDSDDQKKSSPHSKNLGMYYDYARDVTREETDEALRLTGTQGEMLRPYIPRFALAEDDISLAEVLTKMTAQKGDLTVYFDGTPQLYDLLQETFSELPGRTALEKWEFFYLYYRNRIHSVDDNYRNDISTPSWAPLQSKTAFRMRNMLYSRERNHRLVFDLVRILNPLLAEIPYDDDRVNRERKSIQNALFRTQTAPTLTSSSDQTAWKTAMNKKEKNHRYYCAENEVSHKDFQLAKKNATGEEVYSALRAIIAFDPTAFQNMGLAVFVWLKDHPEETTYRNVLINKIFSLYYQILYL